MGVINMVIKCSFWFVVVLLIPVLAFSASEQGDPSVLILNSYHKEYRWSVEMVDAIVSTMKFEHPFVDIRVEHMDAKRIHTKEYFELLAELYKHKFQAQKFELIIACDDYAIDFLLNYSDVLFPEVPIVFAGANRIDISKIKDKGNITGVLERADILKTIELVLQLQPDTKKLVVINDTTITGRFIGEEFRKQLPDIEERLEVTLLEGLPFGEIEGKLSTLTEDTVVLLLVYVRDKLGNVYAPSFVSSMLSRKSSVPVYGVWDFYFDNGIVGGVMTSGYLQGEIAGDMGNRILKGIDVSEIKIITQDSNRLLIDHRQIKRFNLALERLPADATVKNIDYTNKKNVLLLHSYSQDNPWTSEISRGLIQGLASDNTATYSEYMDTKRYSDKSYINQWTNLLQHKYSQKKIDLIIVSDDNAFNLIRRLRNVVFPGVPVVFCGVNYLENPQDITAYNMTGVMESYDIPGTIQLGVQLFPETETVFVINDATTTGKANQQRLDLLGEHLPEGIDVVYSGDISMQQLIKTVAELDEKTIVLLMSFTRDKNNNRFSYQESASLISSNSKRPVFGFWDFYLGHGILGGVITGGYEQGLTAGMIGTEVLSGTSPGNIPVVEQSPVRATVDYDVAVRFQLESKMIPANVEIINKSPDFFEKYRAYIYLGIATLIVLILLILLQTIKILGQSKKNQQLSVKAENDALTKIKNRDYFSSNIVKIFHEAINKQEPFTLCFFDLDNLKNINDTYGHKTGDEYILLSVEAIRAQIRENDIFCRMGGDEFVAVLQNCHEKRGRELCETAQQYLLDLAAEKSISWPLGLSYGVSELDLNQPVSYELLIQQADSDMYRNKVLKKVSNKRLRRTHFTFIS